MPVIGLVTDEGLGYAQQANANAGWFIYVTKLGISNTAGIYSTARTIDTIQPFWKTILVTSYRKLSNLIIEISAILPPMQNGGVNTTINEIAYFAESQPSLYTVNTSTNEITIDPLLYATFADGDQATFRIPTSGGVMTGGITEAQTYWIKKVGLNKIKLYGSKNNAIIDNLPVDLTSAGSGDLTIQKEFLLGIAQPIPAIDYLADMGEIILDQQFTMANAGDPDLFKFFYTQQAGPFTALSDTPDDYTGKADQFVKVNGTADGLDFSPFDGSFLGLSDSPNSYFGENLNHVRVNAGGTGLEFVAPPAVSSVAMFKDLTDVPDYPPGDIGLVLYNNSVANLSANKIEFTTNLDDPITDGRYQPGGQIFNTVIKAVDQAGPTFAAPVTGTTVVYFGKAYSAGATGVNSPHDEPGFFPPVIQVAGANITGLQTPPENSFAGKIIFGTGITGSLSVDNILTVNVAVGGGGGGISGVVSANPAAVFNIVHTVGSSGNPAKIKNILPGTSMSIVRKDISDTVTLVDADAVSYILNATSNQENNSSASTGTITTGLFTALSSGGTYGILARGFKGAGGITVDLETVGSNQNLIIDGSGISGGGGGNLSNGSSYTTHPTNLIGLGFTGGNHCFQAVNALTNDGAGFYASGCNVGLLVVNAVQECISINSASIGIKVGSGVNAMIDLSNKLYTLAEINAMNTDSLFYGRLPTGTTLGAVPTNGMFWLKFTDATTLDTIITSFPAANSYIL